MFKVNGEVLQNTVTSLVKGAKKARLGEKACFIKTEGNFVSFYFNGDDLQVEKKIEAEITGNLDIATSMLELDLKVSALPSDEEIIVELEGSLLNLRWGRSSKIACETLAETAPLIDIPQTIETITWEPGILHSFSRSMPPFAALSNSQMAKANPCLQGLYFAMDDTGEVLIRASNGARAVTLRSEKVKWFEGMQFSIPTESICGLADLLPSDSEISIGINEARTLLVFQAGLTTAVSRLLIGKFPDIDRSYSDKDTAGTKWTFDRMELIELCRRARRLAPSRPVITFRTEGAKTKIDLESILTQQLGAMCEGEQFEFAVNAEYVELAASLFRTEEILILFKDKTSPLTIACEQTDHIRALVGQMEK